MVGGSRVFVGGMEVGEGVFDERGGRVDVGVEVGVNVGKKVAVIMGVGTMVVAVEVGWPG